MANINKSGESPAKVYFFVMGCFLALYCFTCAPGLLWQDSGEFQHRVWLSNIDFDGSLVRSHPLYVAICMTAKLIPWGDFAGKVNMVSALFGAITIANMFYLVRLWTSSNKAAFASVLSLGLAWTFWQHAAIAEVYTLYTAILSAELIMFYLYLRTSRSEYLYLVFFLNGLSISNHIFGIFPLACYSFLLIYFLVRGKISLKVASFCGLSWLVGDALYLFLFVGLIVKGGGFFSALKSATVGEFHGQITSLSISGRGILENIGFIFYNFCSPSIFLLLLGVGFWRKGKGHSCFTGLCLCIMSMFFIFAFRYNVPDRYAFFMPFYLVAAIFIGLGADLLFSHELFSGKKAVISIFLLIIASPLLLYWQMPLQLERYGFSIGTKRQIPYRNDYEYFLRPWQHSTTQAERFALESLTVVPPHASILADGGTFHPLWLAQAIGKLRPDVNVIAYSDSGAKMDDIKRLVSEGLLYVVTPLQGYCPHYILNSYDFVKAGPIYKVTEKVATQVHSLK